MRKLAQKGIATIAAVVAIAAVAGAATGTPIAVDEIDTNPNSPFYSLERVGERIKEATYAGGLSWNLQRAKERTKEYRAVAKNKVPNDRLNLLEDAGNRISKAVKGIDSGKELQKVKETLQFPPIVSGDFLLSAIFPLFCDWGSIIALSLSDSAEIALRWDFG